MGALALLSVGCAAGNRQIKTPRYSLTVPDYWEVKQTGDGAGKPTSLTISQFDGAVIDDGTGAGAGAAYEGRMAPVDVRIFAWPDAGGGDAIAEVTGKLAGDTELELTTYARVAEQPIECGRFARTFKWQGAELKPIDVIKQLKYRAMVLGQRREGTLLGLVARVEFEQDMIRYCQNLINMQVQVQNLLDALQVEAGVPPGAGAPSAAVPAASVEPVTPAPANAAGAPAPEVTP
jgi:hypothetical protein